MTKCQGSQSSKINWINIRSRTVAPALMNIQEAYIAMLNGMIGPNSSCQR